MSRRADRTVLKHSNESAFETSPPIGYNEQGRIGASTGICRGNSMLVLIYLFGLEFLNLLYPKVQLTEHNHGLQLCSRWPKEALNKHTGHRQL